MEKLIIIFVYLTYKLIWIKVQFLNKNNTNLLKEIRVYIFYVNFVVVILNTTTFMPHDWYKDVNIILAWWYAEPFSSLLERTTKKKGNQVKAKKQTIKWTIFLFIGRDAKITRWWRYYGKKLQFGHNASGHNPTI